MRPCQSIKKDVDEDKVCKIRKPVNVDYFVPHFSIVLIQSALSLLY